MAERLRQGPPAEDASIPAPPRWTLRRVRAACPWLRDYSLSGVWRYLRRGRLQLRAAGVQHDSPDPDYRPKTARLLRCLRDATRHPGEAVLVFLDEMGYTRWPEPSADWVPAAPAPPPVAAHGAATNQQWRVIGALNALTGRVDSLDHYLVGRRQVIAFCRQLARAYPRARRIDVVQDNWSIPRHEEVAAALAALPQIVPVWLPAYAPWLNPIEKLWRWLRQDVLTLHRLAGDWPARRAQVRAFLARFAGASQALLHYVGRLGTGRLARALRRR